MSLQTFLDALFDRGHVLVPQPDQLETPEDLRTATELLVGFEKQWRLEFPGEPPEFDEPAAVWAATVLYRAAQAAVFRDVAEETMRHGLSVTCPPGKSAASQHYSVDLALRFLSDLANLARRTSSGDPLLAVLEGWANQWPLSSVGMKGIAPASVDAVVSHAGLLQLYVDRILSREDFSRLAEERVRTAARKAVGAYAELSPALLKHLQKHE